MLRKLYLPEVTYAELDAVAGDPYGNDMPTDHSGENMRTGLTGLGVVAVLSPVLAFQLLEELYAGSISLRDIASRARVSVREIVEGF